VKTTIKTIEHNKQRYDTIGDWKFDRRGDLHIKVSDLHNADFEFLVGIHEAIEAFLCMRRGITGNMVDAFDLMWKGEGEPGDDKKAPYHKEHVFATKIERQLATELGVDWDAYDEYINKLQYR
jgi:glycosidase